MGRRGRWLAVALAGGLIVAAGCGDGDGDGGAGGGGAADDYIAAIVETFGDEAGVGDDAKECVARAYVDAIGVDKFEDADVSPDDIRDNPDATPEEMGIELSEDQLAELSEAALKCPGVEATGG